MHFFLDRNIPEKLARMLGHYDRQHSVIYHDELFDKTTKDTEWLAALALRDPVPVVLSGDGRILKNPAELQVLKNLNLTFFLLAEGWLHLRWPEYAWKAVKIWPEIVAAANPPRPSIYRVPISANKIEFQMYTIELSDRHRSH